MPSGFRAAAILDHWREGPGVMGFTNRNQGAVAKRATTRVAPTAAMTFAEAAKSFRSAEAIDEDGGLVQPV